MKKIDLFEESTVGGDDASSTQSHVRTSQQVFVGSGQQNDDPIFVRVRQREAAFLKIGLDEAEDTQVTYYGNGSYFLGHHDYTPPGALPDNIYFAGGGNRLATLLYYLNDVPKGGGGDTTFPFAQDQHPVHESESHLLYNEKACASGGLAIHPKRGRVILFYSLLENGHMDGAVDPLSLHAACPLVNAEKWIANQWFRNKRVSVDGRLHLYDNDW